MQMLAPMLIGRHAEHRQGIFDDLKRDTPVNMGLRPAGYCAVGLAGQTAELFHSRLAGQLST